MSEISDIVMAPLLEAGFKISEVFAHGQDTCVVEFTLLRQIDMNINTLWIKFDGLNIHVLKGSTSQRSIGRKDGPRTIKFNISEPNCLTQFYEWVGINSTLA